MATLKDLRTTLDVKDIAETIAFYGRVGFSLIGTFGEDSAKPTWCQVQRDGVRLMFTHGEPHEHEDGSTHSHDPALGGALYIDVDDVDAIYEELKAAGIEILAPPVDQPHGMREVAIEDPNDFLIVFGAPTD